ncbi:hypothetical protein DM02DRAFT_634844 [Periconia macrospinosa]|uniref:Uncharacterized protein n=1 Tax=Periconia macrospinosa TaxID=97972 RepID=A0A2V1D4X2_9PLEO|nr:hypothetical protein DM02DRAFT_634844 [Periconia macrospinosa]
MYRSSVRDMGPDMKPEEIIHHICNAVGQIPQGQCIVDLKKCTYEEIHPPQDRDHDPPITNHFQVNALWILGFLKEYNRMRKSLYKATGMSEFKRRFADEDLASLESRISGIKTAQNIINLLKSWNCCSDGRQSETDSASSTATDKPDVETQLRKILIQFLKSRIKHPLSLLAMLSDYGAALSGSGALKVILDALFTGSTFEPSDPDDALSTGSTFEPSDLDIYIPARIDALHSALHILEQSGVCWANFLSDKLEDVSKYGATMFSFSTIHKTIRIMEEYEIEPNYLEGHLLRSLAGLSTHREFIPKFVSMFCRACQSCAKQEREHVPDSVNSLKDSVWMFYRERSRFGYASEPVLKAVENLISILDEDYPEEHELDEDLVFQIREDWLGTGLDEELLAKYLVERIMERRRYKGREMIVRLVTTWFNISHPDSAKETNTKTDRDYGFRVLNGRVPDSGKQIQVIIVPWKPRSVMRTILSFYATHVMCFISGSIAAHLYFSGIENRQASLLDFEGDKRQGGALESIKKWEARGWRFTDMDRTKNRIRQASDDGKFISLEGCFTSVFQKMHKGKSLPHWWQGYFARREEAVRAYSWWESKGKIIDVYRRSHVHVDDGEARLLGWVQSELNGHEDVMPQGQERDKHQTVLDLWFGGIEPPSYLNCFI